MIEQNVRSGDFNGIADTYGRYRTGYSGELFTVLESLGFRRGLTILDAGCGTGLSTKPLLARGMAPTGLDASADMLAAARLNVPGVTFVEGRVEALPFGDRTFDGAISAQSFHWFDMRQAFAELIRVVKPGAPVAVWWKMLASDDGMRQLRAAACALAGVEPAPDPLRGGFRAFYDADFANRTLRVLPFTARFTVEDWLGYEHSRVAARDAYGAKYAAYIDALRAEMLAKYGSSQAYVDARYTQYLYVGVTAAP